MNKMTNMIEILERMGFHTVDSEYRTLISEWLSWYTGKVENFHRYNVFNGIQEVGVERASLGMAKTVCEDWANLLLNERVQISVDDERAQEAIDEVLRENRFGVEGNRTVEAAFAGGTGAFSEWLDAEGQIHIDYHDARAIWPLKWSGHKITECAFSSVEVVGGKKCIYLRIYRRDDAGKQIISNRWLDYDSGNELPVPEGILPEVVTGISHPLFQIISPNIANNVESTCPMGISVFANAIDALKAVDIAFDSFRNEFLLGRKRLLVPQSMVQIQMTRDGQRRPIFDPNDLVFTAYEAGEDVGDFHDLSPEIRADQHITGIRTQLNLLSCKCGLGTGRYEFDRAAGVKTATEVVSEQSDLYQSVCKHELILGEALRGLVRVLCELLGFNTEQDIRITFDDSIIQDKASIRAEAREEVSQGVMSKFFYLTKIRGMGEDEAREELAHIAEESRVTGGAIDYFNFKGAE